LATIEIIIGEESALIERQLSENGEKCRYVALATSQRFLSDFAHNHLWKELGEEIEQRERTFIKMPVTYNTGWCAKRELEADKAYVVHNHLLWSCWGYAKQDKVQAQTIFELREGFEIEVIKNVLDYREVGIDLGDESTVGHHVILKITQGKQVAYLSRRNSRSGRLEFYQVVGSASSEAFWVLLMLRFYHPPKLLELFA
jgi:hypothetical protein